MSSVISNSAGFFERLGWRSERRPEPGFAHTLGAGAAFFVVLAIFLLILEVTSDDPTLPGVLFFMALLVVGLLVGAAQSGPIRSAAVTAIVFSVFFIWGFAFFGDGGSTGDARAIYLLSIASYAALYTVLWTRGRAIVLGLILLFLVGWIIFEVGSGDAGPLPFGQSVGAQVPFDGSSGGFDQPDNNTSETSAAALAIGIVYLLGAAVLDRKKLEGAATPFIAVGAISTVAGALVLSTTGSDPDPFWAGFALTAAGIVVGLIGGWGTNRRASTWGGVVAMVVGIFLIILDILDQDDPTSKPLEYAGMFALAAIILGAAAWWAAPRLNEYVDGDVNAGTTG